MKTKKSFFVLTAVALAFALAFNACSGGGGGPGKAAGLRFNLTGAKAIFGTGSGSGSARAVTAGNGLFKILENGTIESITDGKYNIPEVMAIIRSPVTKDIYFVFLDPLRTDEGDLGNFIHVREDGSVFPIREDFWVGPRKEKYDFDRHGNLYFMSALPNEKIFKYNPVTGAKQQIASLNTHNKKGLAATPNKIRVSSEGSHVFVHIHETEIQGDEGEYLKLIPVANPDKAETFFSGGWGIKVGDKFKVLQSLACHPQNNEIYFTIYEGVIDNVNLSSTGLSSLYKTSSKDIQQWEQPFTDPNQKDISEIIFASDGSLWGIYDWYVSRLIDKNGHSALKKINDIGDGYSFGDVFKSSGSHLYFRYYKSSFSTIYRVSLDDPSKVENIFDGIKPPRDKNSINFATFDIGGDYLYFGGYEGVVNSNTVGNYVGRIDLNNFKYTEFSSDKSITALIGY